MPRNCVFLAFLLFAAVPGFADMVILSVSEQVQGEAGVAFCIDPPTHTGCFSDSFSFSDSNSQPGAYQVSKSGQAVADARPLDFRNLLATSGAQQMSDVGVGNFQVDMDVTASVFGLANHIFGADASTSSQFLLVFSLSGPAIVHLTGSVEGFSGEAQSGGSADADGQLVFTGPALQFERDADSLGTVDELFLLDPGT